MERTIGIVIFTVIAVIIAGILLLFVRKSLQIPYSTGVNLTQEGRGLFTPPACDEQACELSDSNANDCLLPACVNGGCVQGTKNSANGTSCVLPNGTAGSCDGNGACIMQQCADARDNATVCGVAVCGTAMDTCDRQRSCRSCGTDEVCNATGQCVAAEPCVRFETTYFTTMNDPYCRYPIWSEWPYNCSGNEDPQIPRAEGGVVWKLNGQNYLIDADGGYYMRSYAINNTGTPVNYTHLWLWLGFIQPSFVMNPFVGFSVVNDDPIGYARYGLTGYLIFRYDPATRSVTRLYQYPQAANQTTLIEESYPFKRGEIVHVNGNRYLIGRLTTNEELYLSPDRLGGISIYRLGDDGVPQPLSFIDYGWSINDGGGFFLYQDPNGNLMLYTDHFRYPNQYSPRYYDAWNLSDPTHPIGPFQVLNESGQSFKGFPDGWTNMVFDPATRRAYINDGGMIAAYDWTDPLAPKRLGAMNLSLASVENGRMIAERDGLVYVSIVGLPRFGALVSFVDPSHPFMVPDQDGVLQNKSITYPGTSGYGADILHDATTNRYYIYRSNFMTADEISVDAACVGNPPG
jgi:hypothetical protein